MSNKDAVEVPFKLPIDVSAPSRRYWLPVVKASLEYFLGFPELNSIYRKTQNLDKKRDFVDRALNILGTSWDAAEDDLAKIPKTGPVVVVANHPFGAIEGMIIASVLRSVRPDVKVLANDLLQTIPEMRELIIAVDPFGGDGAKINNIGPMKSAIGWLRNGGILAVFPAGEVSHFNLRSFEVQDPPWSTTIAKIIRRTEATVVPVYFNGRNGAMFQLAGLVHPRLRTVLLTHELLKKKQSSVPLRIGGAMPFSRLEEFKDDKDLIEYLRMRTYILAKHHTLQTTPSPLDPPVKSKPADQEPLLDPVNPELFIPEVDQLPTRQTMLSSGDYSVHLAKARQIPNLLREIGRLREYTFRQVGEGTGKPLDLDKFDQYYLHLFVWNRARKEIVGAYRIGQTDLILRAYGKQGLYTSTLFHFHNKLLKQISPGLELGRSFVRPEYQKSYSALVLLWKGIGAYVVRKPRYRYLFGPVSINNEYQTYSRTLMVRFLEMNKFLPHMASLLRPRNPLRKPWRYSSDPVASSHVVQDIEEVSTLIAEIESERNKSVPILLRQYLKLNGKLLGFNVDPDFGDVLDGLILIDLITTDYRTLEHYLGREGCADFFRLHGAEPKPERKPKKAEIEATKQSG